MLCLRSAEREHNTAEEEDEEMEMMPRKAAKRPVLSERTNKARTTAALATKVSVESEVDVESYPECSCSHPILSLALQQHASAPESVEEPPKVGWGKCVQTQCCPDSRGSSPL